MNKNESYMTAASNMADEERLKTAATALTSNIKLHATRKGEQTAYASTVEAEFVQKLIETWPATSKKAAKDMIDFYGQPDEATSSMLIWHYNGPFKRTIVHREEVPHDFPEPHTDVIQQFINYHVPADKVGLVAQMDGSVVIDRTKGEVSVHCDNEGANILSLNMMHEVVTGKRTPEEAREFIAKEIVKYLLGRPAPYAEHFQFELPKGEQWDTDTTIVDDIALNEAVKKAKEKFGYQ